MRTKHVRMGLALLALIAIALPVQAENGSVIGMGDFIYVDVYRNEDVSTRTQVDADGNIAINYIGPVQVAGLTENQAAAAVSSALKRILKNPRVTISRTSTASFSAMPRKSAMKTDLIALNRSNAADLSNALQGMSSEGGSISFEPKTNTLIITDDEATIENIRSVIQSLDQMDNQMAQIRIEAKFLEVQAGALKEAGIKWWAQGRESVGGFYPSATQSADLSRLKGHNDPLLNERVSNDSAGGAGRRYLNGETFDGRRMQVPVQVPGLGQLFYGFMNDSLDLGIFLDALIADEKAEMLDSPVILATNHRKAKLKLADSFPYSASTAIASGVSHFSTDFMDIGIVMEVTPHIIDGASISYVELELNTEVSYVAGMIGGIPIRSVRSYVNSNKVADGQTLVIGGAFRNDDRKVDERLPLLGKVPMIRHLFSHKEKTKKRTELIIFVTPNIHRLPETVTFDTMLGASGVQLVDPVLYGGSPRPRDPVE